MPNENTLASTLKKEGKMEIQEALAIVIDLASEGCLDEQDLRDDPTLENIHSSQQEALVITNNLYQFMKEEGV